MPRPHEPLQASPAHARRTGEARWREASEASAERLFSGWRRSPEGVHLWTQHLCGDVVEYLGAAHGFAGNAHALPRAAPLFSAARRDELYRRCAETAIRTATVEGALANWPPIAGEAGRSEWLAQWCHGAPGIVAALCAAPAGIDGRLEPLLAAGGELAWEAGPLEKGPGLCHGTAGNGYAFLALHRRTGDRRWLERARAFSHRAPAPPVARPVANSGGPAIERRGAAQRLSDLRSPSAPAAPTAAGRAPSRRIDVARRLQRWRRGRSERPCRCPTSS